MNKPDSFIILNKTFVMISSAPTMKIVSQNMKVRCTIW